MAEDSPAISAVMAVHDRADLMDAAIESVLAQSDPDFELVVVDDCSTDGSWERALRWAHRDERIAVHRTDARRGISAVRNLGLRVARGRYLATCDSDDLSRPDRFRVLRAYLDEHPEAVAVGGTFRCFRTDPALDGYDPGWNWGLRDGRLPFHLAAGLMRTDAVRRVGGYDERLPMAEDLDLAYRLQRLGAMVLLPDVLLDYRVHAGGVTRRARERERANLRAQLRGLRAMRGRWSARGYLVLGQSAWRVARTTVSEGH